MLVRECVRAFDKVVKGVGGNGINIIAFCIAFFKAAFAADFYIADVYSAMELRKIYIEPIGVFRLFFEKGTVFYNRGIGRVFKPERITFLIKQLVAVWRKINFIIATRPRGIAAVAGGDHHYNK